MDTTSLLITGQIIFLLLAAIVFLALYARKQKKVVADLQDLLVEYKEDLSGDHLTRYFQLSIDDTTAHSAQDTVALKPDAAPDQMAISLRYHALAAELSLLQTFKGELSPWKSAIEPYANLAAKIHNYIQKVPESVKAEFIPKIDSLENQLNDAKSQYEQVKNQLDNYRQLDAVYQDATGDAVDKQKLEIQLHHALLALAENVADAAAIREVIYLMHEGYLNAKDGAPPMLMESAPDSEEKSPEDTQEMHELIEKFTEESAELVERVYMLNNENKKLISENEELKRQIQAYINQEGSDEQSAPIVAGLQMKVDSQLEEILRLQSNSKQMEEKYLALYADKLDAKELAGSVDTDLQPEEDSDLEDLPDMDIETDLDMPSLDDINTADADASADIDDAEQPNKQDETSTNEAIPQPEASTKEEADEAVDPDAILAEMDEMTSTADSKKT